MPPLGIPSFFYQPSVTLLGAIFLFITWYEFCLERHFILFVFACCYLKQGFASFVSIKMPSIAFTMLSLQVYVLLFENRKFCVQCPNFISILVCQLFFEIFTQHLYMNWQNFPNFSEFFKLYKYLKLLDYYRLFCLKQILFSLHCLLVLMILWSFRGVWAITKLEYSRYYARLKYEWVCNST